MQMIGPSTGPSRERSQSMSRERSQSMSRASSAMSLQEDQDLVHTPISDSSQPPTPMTQAAPLYGYPGEQVYAAPLLPPLLPPMVQNLNMQAQRIAQLEEQVGGLMEGFKAMKVEIGELKQRVADGDEGEDEHPPSKRPRTSSAIRSRDHLILKNKIHEMFWELVNIKQPKGPSGPSWSTLAKQVMEHPPTSDQLETQTLEDGRIMYFPHWSKQVNAAANEVFINMVAKRIFDNEQRFRNAGEPAIPDVSFDRKVIRSIAQSYFSYVARRVRNETTEDGQAKVEKNNRAATLRARRRMKSEARRKILDNDLIATSGIPDADTYIHTDFASSVHEYDSSDNQDGDEESTKRREDQGFDRKAFETIPKSVRSKKYTAFLFWCDWRQRQATASTKTKKHHSDKGPGKNTFYGSYKRANDQIPKATKKYMPYKGMVRKSALKEAGSSLEVQADLPWWDNFNVPADELPEKWQAWLAEIPDDSESEKEPEE
ncbi:hypothetical protein EUX98_g9653 [Antrodiella citrinella]|uniref:Uncharacterized protein n=1 Tax=Antrodiella citrinella TaxID=2447956 RepID=A0A4S4LUW8_9APHY|nr:hypothetical protein EUX98_g9653 [Antrodiella citrinella]